MVRVSKIKKEINYTVILAYIIVFFTFMGSNFAKFSIAGINFNIARIAMLIPIGILFIDIVRNKRFEIKIENKLLRYCVIFLIFFSMYSVLSIYKAMDIKQYLIENYFICIGTINIIFFINKIDFKENIITIFNIISITVMINCLYYLYLFFIQKDNIGGFYHNSNDLATVLLLAIPISIYLIKNNRKKRYKIFQSTILIIDIISFVNIQSRACILGMSLLIFSFIIITIIKNRNKILNSKILKYCMILVIISSIIIVTMVARKYIGKISFKPIEKAKASNEIRTNLIFNGIHFLKQDYNWLIGIGAGNSEYYLRNNAIYSLYNIYSFHNPTLEIGVTYGLVILLCIMIIYTIIIVKLLSVCMKEKKYYTEATIMTCFLISMIIAGISSSSILTREWIWIITGIVVTYLNKNRLKEGN